MDRFVTAIYCDDIREEVGGKRSFMGVYAGGLTVQNAPVVLPRLCVIVILNTPMNRPFTKCVIRILRDDETMAEMQLESEALEMQSKIAAESIPPDLENPSIVLHAVAQFMPFPILGNCKLRIRVQTEEEELKGPALEIKVATATVATATPPAA